MNVQKMSICIKLLQFSGSFSADIFGCYFAILLPGRNEIDDTQELNYRRVMQAIADLGFTGFVAQEFVPKRDPLTSLKQA